MDYIKRETILKALSKLENSTPFVTDKELLETAKKKIEKIPAEDVQGVKEGIWIEYFTGTAVANKIYKCSCCKKYTPSNSKNLYCPNCGARCGAKMESEE